MKVDLYSYQVDAIKQIHNGSILCGGVGTGKSRTSIAYALIKELSISARTERTYVDSDGLEHQAIQLGTPCYPKDIYVITTAKKRDTGDWEKEFRVFGCSLYPDLRMKVMSKINCRVDSWNNIGKYIHVKDAMFIFDEQRISGKGKWVKHFWKIARFNNWILLSATPGDTWFDYFPVFKANGFYETKTEFEQCHVIYKPYRDYKDVDYYINEDILYERLDQILVVMKSPFQIQREHKTFNVRYDHDVYKKVMKYRWDPYDDCPIENIGKLCYILRRIVNSDSSRMMELRTILTNLNKAIIFYNYTYELEILRRICSEEGFAIGEWNGEKHTEIPKTDRWVYLCQYSSASEGWNCIETNVVIFYSLSYSYKMTEQARGRIDRLNTPFDTLYYFYLISNAPIDCAVKRALDMKQNFNKKKFVGG